MTSSRNLYRLFLLVVVTSLAFDVSAQMSTDLLNNLSPEQIDQLRQLPTGELEKLKTRVQRPLAQPLNTLPGTPNTLQGTPEIRQGAAQIEGRVKGSGERAKLTETKDEKVIDTKTAPPKQFGYDLFEGIATTFAPVTDIPITADYLIGPGDTVIINYLGARNEQYSLLVNREGQLTLPGIGQVVVAGMTFEQMSKMTLERVGKQMIGVQASVTMGPLRSIRVFILGEANRPGSYTVSALSTITNALFVSGGVKGIGSLRNIELRRGNKVIHHLDLYDLMMRGDTRGDERLQPGDVIFIPKIGPTATVIGEVLRPAIYELKGEKNSQELLELAGGMLPGAFPQSSQMERVDNHRHKTLVDVDLSENRGKRIAIQDGDILRVYSVLDKLEKVVLLSGHVTRAGGIQWRPGMRLTDLVTNYDDLLPKPDMQYALLKRELPPDRRIQVISVDLQGALSNKSSAANIELQTRDELIVFSSEEPRADKLAPLITLLKAQARRNDPERLVSIYGHVRFSGSYPFEENMPLQRLLQAAADVRSRADLNHMLLVRQEALTRAISSYVVDVETKDQLGFKLQAGDELYVFSLDEDKKLGENRSSDSLSTKDGGLDEQTGYTSTPTFDSQVKDETMDRRDLASQGRQALGRVTQGSEALGRVTQGSEALGRVTQGSEALGRVTQRRAPRTLGVDDATAFSADSPPSRRILLKPVLQRIRQQARSGYPAAIVSIAGAVVAPGEYPLTQSMKISDLVSLSGKFREEAYVKDGELTRMTLEKGQLREITHQYIDFAAIARGDLSKDLALQPYDNLVIRPIPGWEDTATVEIVGKVRFPGRYVFKRAEKLSELVNRAGGFLDEASPDAAVLTRVSLQTKEQESLDSLAQRLESEVASITVRGVNTAAQQGTSAVAPQAAMLDSLIRRVRATKAVGRLSIDLSRIMAETTEKTASTQDVTLEAGDRLFVPSLQESVMLIGEVNFPTTLRYEKGMSLSDYLDSAGGPTQNADSGSTYVIRANGKVQANRSNSWLVGSGPTVNPGDTIVVPLDVKQVAPIAMWSSISQIFSNMAVSVAALKTIGVVK